MRKKKIIKTSEQAQNEIKERDEKDKQKKEDRTCPECGHYEESNALLRTRSKKPPYEFYRHFEYKCKKCGCEWEIEEV